MKKNNALSTIAKLIAFSTVSIYGFNKFISYCNAKNNSLDDSDGTYYLWKYGKIFYKKEGTGDPLVLVHDLSHCASGKEWDKITTLLSNNHTVYTIDLLGCGRSDKPSITYTNYMYVQMISDFIKDVIKDKTDLIISGDSCPIAITTANNDNSLINKIVMINPPSVGCADMIPNSNTRETKRIIELPLIGTFAFNLLNTRAKCFETSIEEYFTKDDYTSYTYSHTMYDSAHKNGVGSKYVMASIIGLYTNLSIRRPLVSIPNDIFIIGGANEINIEESISSYRAIRPNVSSSIVEFSKHFPQLENPKEVYNLLDKYLN